MLYLGVVEAASESRPQDRQGAHALRYVPALDGVRAIAVAGVLLYHGRSRGCPAASSASTSSSSSAAT